MIRKVFDDGGKTSLLAKPNTGMREKPNDLQVGNEIKILGNLPII